MWVMFEQSLIINPTRWIRCHMDTSVLYNTWFFINLQHCFHKVIMRDYHTTYLAASFAVYRQTFFASLIILRVDSTLSYKYLSTCRWHSTIY